MLHIFELYVSTRACVLTLRALDSCDLSSKTRFTWSFCRVHDPAVVHKSRAKRRRGRLKNTKERTTVSSGAGRGKENRGLLVKNLSWLCFQCRPYSHFLLSRGWDPASQTLRQRNTDQRTKRGAFHGGVRRCRGVSAWANLTPRCCQTTSADGSTGAVTITPAMDPPLNLRPKGSACATWRSTHTVGGGRPAIGTMGRCFPWIRRWCLCKEKRSAHRHLVQLERYLQTNKYLPQFPRNFWKLGKNRQWKSWH